MVDDLLCITECGHKTAMMNGYINFKTSSKKLQFGGDKCKKLHVGHTYDDYKCQDLSVDKWSEVEITNDVTGEIDFKDVYDGVQLMEEKEEDKYLGDVISKDGKNIKNIKARIAKGTGIVNKILTILDGIHFGKHFFKVGVLLRNTLLVSSVLFNSEAWYNVTSAELNLLETVDLLLLRQILKAPRETPKEIIYLELGCIPLREIIRERRLMFLHYILNEESNSLIYRFFQSQFKNKTKKDWVTTVLDDLEHLDLKYLTMETIKKMKKTSFKKLIKQKTFQKTFENFEKIKSSHLKVVNVEHCDIIMQKYLQPNTTKMTKEDAQLIFKLRCRMTEAKVNLKGKYDDLECGACGLEEESQQHIIKCKELNKNRSKEEVEYSKIFNGTVIEKLKIAKMFQENFEILEARRKG